MLTGKLSSRREAILEVSLVSPKDGCVSTLNAIVDTGYNGWLTLSPHIIQELGLKWQRFGSAELADGTLSHFDVYEGFVIWDDQQIAIDIDEIDAHALLGMSLMHGFELKIPVLEGSTFTLTRIENSSTSPR